MSHSIIRALSPALAGIQHASLLSAHPESGVNAQLERTRLRHHNIMGVNSVHELIELIPSDYRSVLADPLNGLVTLVHKRDSTRRTLAKYSGHKSAGTFPTGLVKGSAPKVQHSKEYAASEQARRCKDEMDSAFSAFQIATLDSAIKSKRDEVAAQDLALSPSALWNELRGIVAAHAPSILARNKLPIQEADDTITGWEPSDVAVATRDHVMLDCSVYASRVISITESVIANRDKRIQKKKQVADHAATVAGDVDVDMAAAPAGASIKKLVDRAVASALKAQNQQAGPSKRKRGDADSSQSGSGDGKRAKLMQDALVSVDCSTCAVARVDVSFSEPTQGRNRQNKGRDSKVRATPLPSSKVSKLFTKGDPRISAGQREGTGRRAARREKRTAPRQGKERRLFKGPIDTLRSAVSESAVRGCPSISGGSSLNVSACGMSSITSSVVLSSDMRAYSQIVSSFPDLCEGDLWISNPSLMPDWLLDLSIPNACDEIVSRMSLETISLLSY